VYLGMYTQFHVDTVAGRVVSHRLAEDAPQLAVGSQVSVSWDAERSYPLAEPVPV
jgi:Ser-tRNA(Ala) deacylase AlaX